MENLEHIIDQIVAGKTPKNVEPEIVELIQDAISQMDNIQIDPKFKVELTEKIHAKLYPKESTFWGKFRAPVGVFTSLALVVLGGLYVFNPNKTNMDLQVPTSGNNNAASIPKEAETRNDADNTQTEPSFLNKLTNNIKAKTHMDSYMTEETEEILAPSIKMMPPVGYHDDIALPPVSENRENYDKLEENAVKSAKENPVSTFSIDVDTGGYSNVRRFLREGTLPPKNAVRVEEMINYFAYDYEVPETLETPFSTNLEISQTPWNENTKLLHIGIKGYEKENSERLSSNLVFLLDVSGSMNNSDKLPLLKKSLKMLAKNLNSDDKISIVTYAGSTNIVLDGADGNSLAEIEMALDNLNSGGSTAGAAGIDLAYKTAEKNFIKDGINRILLATDGDFNVGITDFNKLKEMVEKKRENGVSLTTLGFGQGNLNDHLMEQLSDAGNGNYAYIDSILEAKKVLVTEIGSTLETIAKDVKIQIEFNPELVSEYRLIGYENRILNREDFNNDKIDAGEIGAGHTVTAIYEIALVGEGGELLAPLRYDTEDTTNTTTADFAEELAFLKIRYKAPNGFISKLLEFPVTKDLITEKTSDNFEFSAAVAAFGQKLRNSKYLDNFSYDDIRDLAKDARGNDEWGYRSEFLQLVDLSESLDD
ncbi:MAG: VWA domain-containing protein [Candidatus Peregrinibacteria bacterium]|nr:VWA domain-containing protein [Candidatus Peregrinibacteria bacterium]